MFGYTRSNPWQPYVHRDDSPLTFNALTGFPVFDEQSTDGLVDTAYPTVVLDNAYNEMETTTSVPVEENIDEIEQLQMLSNSYAPHVEVETFISVLDKLLMSRIGATGWRTTACNSSPRSVRRCRSDLCS